MTSVRVIAIDAAHPLLWIDASIDDQWLVRQLRGSHLQRMFTGTAPCGASRLRQVGQQLTQRNGIRRLQSCIRLNLPICIGVVQPCALGMVGVDSNYRQSARIGTNSNIGATDDG